MLVSKIQCRVLVKRIVNCKSYLTSTPSDSNNVRSKDVKYNSQNVIKEKHRIVRQFATNVSYKLSDIGEGIRDVVIKEWFVKIGDRVSQFDKICEVQSDKASVTITSRYDGIITKLHHNVDDTALVGQPLVDIEVESDDSSDTPSEKTISVPEPVAGIQEPIINNYAACIPSVRRLAKQYNINLFEVKATGKNGRILREDIIKYLDEKSDKKVKNQEIKAETPNVIDKTEPIRGFQKAMVKTMTESLKIPHFIYSEELSITKLSKLRKNIQEDATKNNIKISFMPFFVKAVSNALKKHPILNSSVDENCENIIYKSSHNIGIAMDTKVGLAVPVIKNVEKLGVLEIARELSRLMVSGKEGAFSTNDLSGGTFAISNIGIIGGTYTKPVILPPNVAIIAIGRSKIVPRYDSNDQVVPEEILNLSAAADHRIIDGATMARFVNLLKKQVENPYLIFLNLL